MIFNLPIAVWFFFFAILSVVVYLFFRFINQQTIYPIHILLAGTSGLPMISSLSGMEFLAKLAELIHQEVVMHQGAVACMCFGILFGAVIWVCNVIWLVKAQSVKKS